MDHSTPLARIGRRAGASGPSSRSASPTARRPCPHGLAHLVARMATGDVAALGRLYDRLGAVVFATACHPPRAGRGDPRAAAGEVTLEVFGDLWRRAPQFDPATDDVLVWLADSLPGAVDIAAWSAGPANRQ